MMNKGRIVRVTGGHFYIKDGDRLVDCVASGKLRDFKVIPVCGDIAIYESLDDNKGYIKSIEERKNSLVRPPVSNIDQALIVTSLKEPNFSVALLEKLLLQIIDNDITPVIYFSKSDKVDMKEYEKYIAYYKSIGIDCYFGNSLDLKDDNVKHIFKDKITVLTGQSGAGKSTLLNAIDKELNLRTGEISFSLGRGKHTTREVEFMEICDGLVADTPGFSSLQLNIDSDRLATIYPGFSHFNECKFRGCKHNKEIGCKIKEEVEEGKILPESYKNYLDLLEEAIKGEKR